MGYALTALVILALFHLVYESILAPSFRTHLRLELFALRDELRKLKINRRSSFDDRHFSYLQDAVNSLIAFGHGFDGAMLAAVENEFRRDRQFRDKVESRSRVLDDCLVSEAKAIRQKSVGVAARLLLVNSGALFVLVAPCVLCMIGIKEARSRLRTVASLSEHEIRKISGPSSTETALT